jgi:hypothetical protein
LLFATKHYHEPAPEVLEVAQVGGEQTQPEIEQEGREWLRNLVGKPHQAETILEMVQKVKHEFYSETIKHAEFLEASSTQNQEVKF